MRNCLQQCDRVTDSGTDGTREANCVETELGLEVGGPRGSYRSPQAAAMRLNDDRRPPRGRGSAQREA